jgi:hypothetical protein
LFIENSSILFDHVNFYFDYVYWRIFSTLTGNQIGLVQQRKINFFENLSFSRYSSYSYFFSAVKKQLFAANLFRGTTTYPYSYFFHFFTSLLVDSDFLSVVSLFVFIDSCLEKYLNKNYSLFKYFSGNFLNELNEVHQLAKTFKIIDYYNKLNLPYLPACEINIRHQVEVSRKVRGEVKSFFTYSQVEDKKKLLRKKASKTLTTNFPKKVKQ